MQEKLQKLICTLFIALLITACSGGGGGSDDGPGLTTFNCMIPTDLVSLTVLNGEAVTIGVVDALAGLLSSANAVGTLISLVDQVAASGPIACDVGGFTIVVTDADSSGFIDQGDSLTANFSSCDLSGTLINGGFTVTYTVATGTDIGNKMSADDWNAVLTGQFDDLEIVEAGETLFINGNFEVDVDFDQTMNELVSSANLDSIELVVDNAECASVNAAMFTSTLGGVNDYSLSFGINELASTSGVEGVVTLVASGTNLTGTEVLAEPDEYFVELDGVMGPMLGDFSFSGQTSGIDVDIMAIAMVDIIVDEDANMSPDGTIMTTWNDLLN